MAKNETHHLTRLWKDFLYTDEDRWVELVSIANSTMFCVEDYRQYSYEYWTKLLHAIFYPPNINRIPVVGRFKLVDEYGNEPVFAGALDTDGRSFLANYIELEDPLFSPPLSAFCVRFKLRFDDIIERQNKRLCRHLRPWDVDLALSHARITYNKERLAEVELLVQTLTYLLQRGEGGENWMPKSNGFEALMRRFAEGNVDIKAIQQHRLLAELAGLDTYQTETLKSVFPELC